ncbi:MAG: ABC transporter substrate-binding protein [Methyloprofundus sp.]|nr:ABC transporter substrate-binding protein [Methyloprofundus sp.]
MTLIKKIALICCLCFSAISFASEKTLIRLGVLAYGTVNWELTALKQQGLLETEQYQLEIIPMTNPQAGKIALLSGSVDMIVADWIWVSRQRSLGKGYTFYPYSNTTGALVLAKNSPIKNLKALANKKLAIAGGALDKNSLLLGAVMQKQGWSESLNSVQKVYGAPSLLAHQLKQGRVDALLTYWHYAARLEAQGYSVFMTGADLLQQLAIQEKVPSIGYVFIDTWAKQHKQAINAFLAKTRQMKNRLCENDDAWQGIQALTHAETEQASQVLRQRYCAGRITAWGKKEQAAAADVYQYLRAMSNQRLTGKAETIEQGTFWNRTK